MISDGDEQFPIDMKISIYRDPFEENSVTIKTEPVNQESDDDEETIIQIIEIDDESE